MTVICDYNNQLRFENHVQQTDFILKWKDRVETYKAIRPTCSDVFRTLEKILVKIVNGFQPITIFAKCFIVVVWQGFNYATDLPGGFWILKDFACVL